MSIRLKPLNEQVIVITGASSGIGLATAESAAQRGAKVVLAARSIQTLNEIVDRISLAGGEALAVQCDVADREQLQKLAQAAIARFGHVDTWVNNAGLGTFGRLDETTEADDRRLFDVNFWGVVNGSLVALPYLKQQGGALINVGSEVSEAFVPMLGMYTATKHAVKGFTDSLRVEIEEIDKAPVAVTLIQPTAVHTPFPQHARNYMDRQPKLPDPMIDPQQVADAILAAAVTPTHAKKVGMMATVNAAMANLAPAMATNMVAGHAKKFKSDDPPHCKQGTLNDSSESMGAAGHRHPLALG